MLVFSAFSNRALSSGVIQNLNLTRLNVIQLLSKVKGHVASIKPINMISAQNAVTQNKHANCAFRFYWCLAVSAMALSIPRLVMLRYIRKLRTKWT